MPRNSKKENPRGEAKERNGYQGQEPTGKGLQIVIKQPEAWKLPKWENPKTWEEATQIVFTEMGDAFQSYEMASLSFYRVGKALAWMKSNKEHGEWLPWVEESFKSERSAQRMMKHARDCDGAKKLLPYSHSTEIRQNVADLSTFEKIAKGYASIGKIVDKKGDDLPPKQRQELVDMGHELIRKLEGKPKTIDVTPEKEKAKGVIEIDALPALKGEGTWDCMKENGGCGNLGIPTTSLTCPECKSPRRKVQPLTAVAGGTARIQQRKVRYKAQKPKNKRGKTGSKKK